MIMRGQNHEEMLRGADKVEKLNWKILDNPGRLEEISKHLLHVATEYQRPAVVQRALDLAGSWSWIACGAIIVGLRDGQYWVIDGQHRVLAARKRSDIKTLPCLVFETADIGREASGFVTANTMRKAMEFTHRHKALRLAGDPLAIAVEEMCHRCGATIAEYGLSRGSSSRRRPGVVSCLELLYSSYRENPGLAEKVLMITSDLARIEEEPITRILFGGIKQLTREVNGCLDDKRFVGRLYSIGAVGLVAAARRHSALTGLGGSKPHGLGMLMEVNKGLRPKYVSGEIKNSYTRKR